MSDSVSTDRVGLRSISLRNFKGVGAEEVVIPLSPVTLLFGPNSAGKSTVLHALLLARAILCEGRFTLSKSAGGPNLGDFSSYVHGHDLSRTVEIGLELRISDDGLEAIPAWEVKSFEDVAGSSVRILLEISWDLRSRSPELKVSIHWDSSFLAKVSGTAWGIVIEEFTNTPPPWWPGEWPEIMYISDNAIYNEEENRWLGCYMPVPGISLHPFGAMSSRGKPEDLEEKRPEEDNDPDADGHWDNFTVFFNILVSTTMIPLFDTAEILKMMRHVGPIRRIPGRGPPLLDFHEKDAWSDGLTAWRFLNSKKEDSDVSRILDAFESLDLGYSLEQVGVLKASEDDPFIASLVRHATNTAKEGLWEMIEVPTEQLSKFLSQQRVEIQMRDVNSGERVDLNDVGVGVSQVLPVLVASLASGSTLVAIEQPELHIHPKVQCLLADVLAHAAIDDDRLLILETHSEHLMLRFLRRIRELDSETLPPGAPKIKPELFSVVCVERRELGVQISPIEITADGDFAEDWPQGFFEERADEMF